MTVEVTTRRPSDDRAAPGRPGTPARPGPRPRPRPRARPRSGLRAAGTATAPFWVLAVTTGLLLTLGLLMTFSASFVQSTVETGDAFGIFTRQLLWCALGLPPMLLAATVDYRALRRLALPLLLVSLALAALVLVPGLGVEVGGARRWFDLGPVSFQPSELLKLSVPLALAHLVARRWSAVRCGELRALLGPTVPVIVVSAALVVVEPDLETALLVAAVGGAVLYAAGLPWALLGVGALAGAVLGVRKIVGSTFREGRIAAWLDPFSDPLNYGFQSVQGLIALGSGGVFGVGLGRSRGKWLYIPNAHTDFIFAIIGEETGLVGALTVLALFLALALGGVLAANRAPDPFGRLLATAVTTWLLLQAGINIGSVVGLLPVTGVTLPLVSFGGSSLVITMAGLGVLMSIARAGRAAPEREAGRA